jgi:hypothetical protein
LPVANGCASGRVPTVERPAYCSKVDR